MSIKLKPCPNCGGQPKIHKTHKKFYVECDGDCWAQTGKHWDQEDAVKEWNTQIAVAKEADKMTDHKLTDNEIIKALNCCAETEYCATCLATDSCKGMDSLMENALALINCQKAEIESLNAVHADMTESLRLAAEANKDMQAEIERLKKIGDDKTSEVLRHDASIRELHKQLENAKAEAIKEFAWRLKNKLTPYPEAPFCEMVGSLDIDALVKEMTEGKND